MAVMMYVYVSVTYVRAAWRSLELHFQFFHRSDGEGSDPCH